MRGAYHFFHANVDPIAEADHFLSDAGRRSSPAISRPSLDLEVTDGQTGATITANTITWLDHVAAATGTKPILYTSPSFVTGTLGSPAGLETHAQLWIANWGVTCPDVPAPFTDLALLAEQRHGDGARHPGGHRRRPRRVQRRHERPRGPHQAGLLVEQLQRHHEQLQRHHEQLQRHHEQQLGWHGGGDELGWHGGGDELGRRRGLLEHHLRRTTSHTGIGVPVNAPSGCAAAPGGGGAGGGARAFLLALVAAVAARRARRPR